MKKIFSKTWMQVLLSGIVLGAVLIVLDNKFHFWGNNQKSGTYNGPVSVDKDKTYFTKATIDATSFDFGKVKEGDTLTHVFKLTNTGDEPLFVYKSTGSCDCVAAVVTKDMIQPGTTVDVTAHFNTKGRKGLQNRILELTLNTEPAQVLITLKAEVE